VYYYAPLSYNIQNQVPTTIFCFLSILKLKRAEKLGFSMWHPHFLV
jgi:hypothetical protein